MIGVYRQLFVHVFLRAREKKLEPTHELAGLFTGRLAVDFARGKGSYVRGAALTTTVNVWMSYPIVWPLGSCSKSVQLVNRRKR